MKTALLILGLIFALVNLVMDRRVKFESLFLRDFWKLLERCSFIGIGIMCVSALFGPLRITKQVEDPTVEIWLTNDYVLTNWFGISITNAGTVTNFLPEVIIVPRPDKDKIL
jgi:hypothetical protein